MTNSWKAAPEKEETAVSIDAYGIKMRPRVADLGEPVPTTWKDVFRQVRVHLLRIAVAPTRLLAEVLEGTTRLVRGISQFPGAVAVRIATAHEKADASEASCQTEALSGIAASEHAPLNPVAQINAILEKYREQGRDAYIAMGPDQTIVVVVGTPADSTELISEAVQKFLSSTSEYPSGADQEEK